MPETKKNSTARTGSARSGGRQASKSSKRGTAKRKQKKPLIGRQVWAGICLFLGLLALLAIFKVKGFAIDWYHWLVHSLIGTGFYVMPFALIASGVLLFTKKKGKARLRVACIMLLPVIFGALVHIFSDKQPYSFSLNSFTALMYNGRAGVSGGLLAGGLAALLKAAFSSIGAVIFSAACFVACLCVGLNTSLMSIIDYFRPLPEEEDELPPPSASPPVRKPIVQKKHGRSIDIALDERPPSARRKEDALPFEPPIVSPITPVTPVMPSYDVSLAEVSRPEPMPEVNEGPMPEPEPTEDFPDIASMPEQRLSEPGPQPEPQLSLQEQIEAAMSEASHSNASYLYPPITLLNEPKPQNNSIGAEVQQCAERLVDTLSSFGIESTVVDVTRGPTITRYELQLQRGTKFSRLTNLADDIALALGTIGVRIAPIPDKLAVGIEVPNDTQQMVSIREIIDSAAFRDSRSKISFSVGKDIAGDIVIGDIAKMPHMLIAGTTGSGKSVCINSILISLIYKSTPEEVRLIMVDPKMIELGMYNGIPHLLIPVVTDPKKAASALNWAVSEMMKRYKLFSEQGARDLASYNADIKRKGEGEVLPQIVIVIDELADLMFVSANEVEEAIARIAQMARAAGMHLIIATQRPSADVITGIMKANIPSRIAFAVASQINSRIILDTVGAEKLIGRGDMLYSPLGAGKPQRVQGCFITTQEVESVVEFIKRTGQADYSQEVMEHIERQAEAAENGGSIGGSSDGDDDPMLEQAISVVVESGQASVSMLQRRLKLGYSRAARLVDQMEERGIVGPFEGSKPRPVLISRDDWKEMAMRRRDM